MKRGFIVHKKLYAGVLKFVVWLQLVAHLFVGALQLVVWLIAACLATLLTRAARPSPAYSDSTVRKNNKRKLLTTRDTNGYFSDPSGDGGSFPSHVPAQAKRFFPPLETLTAAEDR